MDSFKTIVTYIALIIFSSVILMSIIAGDDSILHKLDTSLWNTVKSTAGWQRDLPETKDPNSISIINRQPPNIPIYDCTVQGFLYQPTKDSIDTDTILIRFSEPIDDPANTDKADPTKFIEIRASMKDPKQLSQWSDWGPPPQYHMVQKTAATPISPAIWHRVPDPSLFVPAFSDSTREEIKIPIASFPSGYPLSYYLLIRFKQDKIADNGKKPIDSSTTCMMVKVE